MSIVVAIRIRAAIAERIAIIVFVVNLSMKSPADHTSLAVLVAATGKEAALTSMKIRHLVLRVFASTLPSASYPICCRFSCHLTNHGTTPRA